MRAHHGRTLLEVLLVMSLTGALLAWALPAWGSLLADQRVISAANALVASAQLARSTAITDRVPVTLCPRAATASGCGTDFARGWRLFRDLDGDGRLDADESLVEEVALEGLRAHSNRRVFTWRPWGRRATNGTLTLCGTGTARRAVVVSHVGRPRVTPTASNPC